MRILFYHWVPFYDPRREGGGIAVYMNNLIDYLCKHTDHKISCIFSGYRGNSFRIAPYLAQTHNPYEYAGCKTWEIINAPAVSQLYFNAYNPRLAYEDNPTSDIFVNFVRQVGGFDIIHFHSLEGIPPVLLDKLKKHFPETRLLFSVHDYHPLCPLVRLYRPKLPGKSRGGNCEDYGAGFNCLNCVPQLPRSAYRTPIDRYLADPHNKPFPGKLLLKNPFRSMFMKRAWKRVTACPPQAENFVHYREVYAHFLNSCIDCILPVSKRTGQIMVHHGIRPELLITCYIGTAAAEHARNGQSSSPTDGTLSIAFMGYAQAEEKGFPFLMQSLSHLPTKTASKLRLIVAARGADKQAIQNSLKHLKEVLIYDGYTHDQLPCILSGVHLGIIPVLWEDNLPQVAIEMVAHGVPILCSDMGGASELCDCEDFKFKAGDEADLIQKLTNFVEKPELLYQYWEHHRGLTTMQQHVEQLESIYQQKTS